MKAKLVAFRDNALIYAAFLAWTTSCVIVGIALMTGTSIGVCTVAIR